MSPVGGIFLDLFVSKNGVPKNGFLIVFSKSDLGWGGGWVVFSPNFFLEKAKHPKYAQVLVVTCPKLNSVTALLSPPPKNRSVIVSNEQSEYVFKMPLNLVKFLF